MSMMPRMSDKTFWQRHLKEGMYPAVKIQPAEDFAVRPEAIYERWSYSVAAFEREKRELRQPDRPRKWRAT